MSLEFDSAVALTGKLQRKEISSRELTEHFIARIKQHDEKLNAVVVRDFDRALAAADAADASLAKGRNLGSLHGLPMTIKEAYNVTGLPTTWGIAALKDNIADSDAVTVKRLKAAGAHFLGKTNVPTELGDFQTYNDLYGVTNNPWDTARTPGGSSGGSAAALAAGLTGLEGGSDIGGSIRNPAHYCGVYGHKPTWNVVSLQGHALPGMVASSDLAVVGPMARSADDLALAMDVMAGPDPLNAPGWKVDLPRPAKCRLSEYRVAIWPTHSYAPVSAEIADRVQAVGDRLASLGATVSDSARPKVDFESSYRTYLELLSAVITYGLPEEAFEALRRRVDQFEPGDDSVGAILARAGVQTHRAWLRNNDARELTRIAWREFFDEWDILVCPQMTTPAFEHNHSAKAFDIGGPRTIMVDNEAQPYFQQLFWSGVITVAYLPSTVFPTGPSRTGLPIGLQAVSAEYNDYISIDFARLLADELGGFIPPPGY
ncbi:MAG: amidase [Acidobacteria bacterium]|nr:amidase [Acidobacteriota bacterium]